MNHSDKKQLKVILIGLGTIGSRHAILLKQHFRHQVYAFRSEKPKGKNELKLPELYSWEEVERLNPDVAFITNPTYLHLGTAVRCARMGIHLFIEKPLGHTMEGLDQLKKVVRSQGLTTYVAYNLRFHPVISYLKEVISKQPFIHMRISCTSYLPDWRKDMDYHSSYSANRDMGGGILLDLSHELDYCQFIAGGIQKIDGKFGNSGHLGIDAEDYADLLVQTSGGPVNIHLNMFSRHQQREILVEFGDRYVKADLITNRVSDKYGGRPIRSRQFSTTITDTYQLQLEYFFNHLKDPYIMNNIFEAEPMIRKIIQFKEKQPNGQ